MEQWEQALPRVVIVDDREENLLAFEVALRALPCEIVKCSSGKRAVSYLLQNQVAVVLLDVQMPEMDGFETARLIRKLSSEDPPPILFITATEPTLDLIRKGFEFGGADFISKPIDASILASKVNIFLELFKKRTGSAGSQHVELELKNKEEEFRTLANAIPQLAWMAHPNGDVFWYNERWYEYTGTTFEEMRE